MRIPINKEVDLATLSERLKAVLSRDVALSARMPGQFDAKGNPLPGVLVLLDATTGEPLDLPTGSLADVESAIASHVPPPPPKTPAKALTEQLVTATTAADLKAALAGYASALVQREDAGRRR